MEGNGTNLRLVIIYLLFFIVCITMIFTLSACTEVIDNPSITHTPTQANTNDPTQATGTPTVTVTPTETVTQTPSPTPTPTLTPNTSPGTEVSTHAEFYGKKIVVLTFDDGPHGQYTDRLLDGLKERDVKATFFVTSIGRNNSDWESDKRILTRMVNEGHEIGNHTQHHKTLTKMTDKEIKEEISIISDRVKEMTGYEIKLFRPPSGAFSKKVVDAANLAMVHWTLDTNDWRYLNENTLKKYAEENSLTPEEAKEQRVKYLLDVLVGRLPNNDVYTGALKHGSIILFHDLYEGTVELALSLIDELKKDGYVFLNLTEAVETVGTAPAAGEAYKSIWEGYKINIR